MMAEDITSEQAWEDFKAGYSDFEEKHIGKDRDGDKASLDQKIDVMSAKLEELSTDVARLNDSVPQALGTIEEGKTIEAEAEEDGDIGMNPEAEAEGGGLFGDEDDGLDEYFASDDETDENGEPIDDEANPDVAGDEEEASDESTEQTDETSVNADGNSNGAEVDVEEESTDDSEDSDSTGDEEDFTPIEDIMGDDEEESEDDKNDEQEEVLEKMVRILTKMDRRITRLEKENEGLKKQLSKNMTVQTETTMAKSRPTPNTNLRLVKGSYNRPPVSTQYSANQRDVGVGIAKKKSDGANTSVFNTELNEVFAECNRIANKTR